MPSKNPLPIFQLPKWYTDFDKVRRKCQDFKAQLVKLQKIVRLPNFKWELLQLVQADFKVLELVVLMFAVRWDKFKMKEIWHLDTDTVLDQKKWEPVFTFLEKVGIVEILTSGEIHNFFDYLFGVEVGFDTHGRKKRTGDFMEETVEEILKQKFKEENIIWYEKQMKVTDVFIKHSLKLLPFSETVQKKVFDFIYQKGVTTYLLECNYYNVAGSKIDATISHHQKLHEEIAKSTINCEFIWVTGGSYWNNEKVWTSTRNKIKNLFLLEDFEKNH